MTIVRPCVLIDWGTSSFRLWSLGAQAEVLQRASGAFGMATLGAADFERVLEEQLAQLGLGPTVPVVISGMAGAAQGWHPVDYLPHSTPLARLAQGALRVPNVERQVHILPGVMQREPADVMRGEETQLLGLLHERPDFDGTVCLPGTHSKWVWLRGGRIERFTTCMTGELFALLSSESILKHSVSQGGWDAPAFEAGVAHVAGAPERLGEALFGLRAASLLAGTSADVSRSRLSGLLIGLELAATQAFRQGGKVVLIGDTRLSSHYACALSMQSIETDVVDADQLTRRGLLAAFEQLEEHER